MIASSEIEMNSTIFINDSLKIFFYSRKCALSLNKAVNIFGTDRGNSQSGNKDLRCECHSTLFIHMYAYKETRPYF